MTIDLRFQAIYSFDTLTWTVSVIIHSYRHHVQTCIWTPVVALKSSFVSFIYQLEDEPHIENNQIYLQPLQPHSPVNSFFHAQQTFNGVAVVIYFMKYLRSSRAILLMFICFEFRKRLYVLIVWVNLLTVVICPRSKPQKLQQSTGIPYYSETKYSVD